MKPIICKVPPEIAAPFTLRYCEKYGIPYDGDPSFGNDVLWFGAAYKGAIRSVIGFVGIPEGVYVLGFYQDDTPAGVRALFALNRWTYDLGFPLWGHIREDNGRMWQRLIKEGWGFQGCTKNKELLMYRPSSRRVNMIKCQETAKI